MYQALYRKYRSKTFDQVVGQEQVTQTLKQEIASGRVAHAYLFTGSRGTGKTSCSRIIAKAVNCPNGRDGNPCGDCALCRGIDEGTVLDVVEIDAASNNGVDDIRQLREEAAFTPSQAKYRVYIIDEAHMLSTAAFNALLKILEEPPEHVIFILATTEVHKVPATILSRCQRFDFRRISPAAIAAHLLQVAQAEGIALQEEAAQLIGRLSDGGMRDALSLLDVCRAASNTVDCQVVAQAAGLAMEDSLFAISQALLEGRLAQALGELETLRQASVDFEKMCTQLIQHYRGLMMAKALRDPEEVVPDLPQDLPRLKAQAAQHSLGQILYCLSTLQDALSRMSRSAQPRTELEMALIRMGSPEQDKGLEALALRVQELEKRLRGAVLTAAPAGEPERAPKAPAPKADPAPGELEQLLQKQPLPSAESAAPTAPTELPKEAVQPFEPWEQVLEKLTELNRPLGGALVDSKAYLLGDLVLIDCESQFFLNLIRSDETAKRAIHQAFLGATGRDYRMGPFRKEKYQVVSASDDPMEQLLTQLHSAGVALKE